LWVFLRHLEVNHLKFSFQFYEILKTADYK
jgi:hypothetical protein